MFSLRKSRLAVFTALAITATLSACKDSTSSEPEPSVATMRLIIGSQTINVAANGTVTGGPVSIPKGTTTVTSAWLKADGTVESLVTASTFELRGTTANSATATFTTAALGGTLTGVASGTTQVSFALFHKAEGHNDFGPFPVTVTVQ